MLVCISVSYIRIESPDLKRIKDTNGCQQLGYQFKVTKFSSKKNSTYIMSTLNVKKNSFHSITV